jgi:hypothetical protein
MPKDKRPEWKKVVVDGDTLEKRRDQRAEQLEKYVWERPKDQGPGVLDAVVQWDKEGGSKVVPSSQSLFDLEAEEKKLREVDEGTALLGQDLPPIVKRTPQQRIESLANRLRDSDPAFIEPILKELASEYWKAGMPVSTEDLRAVAASLLNQADRRKG